MTLSISKLRTLDVQQWIDKHLGDSMLVRRRRALRPAIKTA